MAFNSKFGMEDVSPYQVRSRREIIGLLRTMQERSQLVSMQADGGAEAIVTSVLALDEQADMLVIDRAPSNIVNQRILASDNISFETVLDNIRILFFATQVMECLFENQSALYIQIPLTLIRLQRREFYRVPTPVANPLRCAIRIPPDEDCAASGTTVIVTLKDISGGGIAILDEKKLLNNKVGHTYQDCRIELPGGNQVVVALQVRNSNELNLASGKSIRKLGCMFVDPPRPMMAAVQRYITKLERERNAKATGMG